MSAASPRLIVQIHGDRRGARKAILAPGATLRIGRSERADLVVPHDAQVAPAHFELRWDGARCLLRDLGSSAGTLLQGERVSEGVVTSGAWIRVGHTDLSVHVEAHTPPTQPAEAPVEARVGALSSLRREPGPLFAIVDASRGARLLTLLRESVDEQRSLYDGVKGEALARVAPTLVALRRDSGLLDRLVREGWGARWAIYLACARPFDELRRHLRRFLLVEDDDSGERFYFRFYDPRTLRAFLPTCTPRQREDFFGEIQGFLLEGERGELLRFLPETRPAP